MIKHKKQGQAGHVTIEASLSLTAFLFFFLMIYSIISICRVQAKMSVAICNTAKEISQYSYIYGLMGINESHKKLYDSTKKVREDADDFFNALGETFNGIQAVGEQGMSLNIDDIGIYLAEWESSAGDNSAMLAFENLIEDPKALMLGLGKLALSDTYDYFLSNVIAEPVSRALVKKNLTIIGDDSPERYLKSMGVVKGEYGGQESYFNGLSFHKSRLFANGSEEIVIIVEYRVKLLPLLPVDIEISLCQTAITKGWLYGDGK